MEPGIWKTFLKQCIVPLQWSCWKSVIFLKNWKWKWFLNTYEVNKSESGFIMKKMPKQEKHIPTEKSNCSQWGTRHRCRPMGHTQPTAGLTKMQIHIHNILNRFYLKKKTKYFQSRLVFPASRQHNNMIVRWVLLNLYSESSGFGGWKRIVCTVVVKTFSKAAAERLRLIKRQLRLTSD